MTTVPAPPPSPRTTAPLGNTLSYQPIPRDPSQPLAFRFFPRPGLADLCPTEVFTPQQPRGFYRYPRYRHVDSDRWILLQVDGACSKNGHAEHAKGGWGFVYGPRLQDSTGEYSGLLEGEHQTSNRAELRSCIAALMYRVWLGDGTKVVVVATDSEYVVLGITERLAKWKRNGWRTARGSPVANRDLWERLERAIERSRDWGEIGFWLIPRDWNTRADALAVAETRSTKTARLEHLDIQGLFF